MSKRRILLLWAGLALVAALLIAGTGIGNESLRAGAEPAAMPILQQLNLGRENVVAAWFSSMLPLFCALMCLLCFLETRNVGNDPRLRSGWIVTALLFAMMSIDELGSVHERIAQNRELLRTVIALWPLFLALPAYLLAFAWFQLRQSPQALVLLAAGVLCLTSIPVQEYLETLSASDAPGWVRPTLPLLLEEGGELFGMLLCLLAFSVYALCLAQLGARQTGSRNYVIRIARGARPTTIAAGIGAAMLLLLVILLVADLSVTSDFGAIVNWFPSALAATAALLALERWSAARSGGAHYLLLALVCLFASALVGSDLYGEGLGGRWLVTLGIALAAAAVIVDLAWVSVAPHSSVRTSTASPIRRKSANGPQAASRGG